MVSSEKSENGNLENNETEQYLSAVQIVKEHTLYSMSSGIIPIPIVGLFGVMGIQINMINSLCKIYDITCKESTAKNTLISLLGSITSVALAMPLASIVKFIPIIGQSAGGIALSSLSSASTYTIGHYLIKHFEEFGTLDNINNKQAKVKLNKMYEKSKEAVKNIKESVGKATSKKTTTV